MRSGKTESNVMLIVHFSPQSLTEEETRAEKGRIYDSLSSKHPNITSFYWNSVNSMWVIRCPVISPRRHLTPRTINPTQNWGEVSVGSNLFGVKCTETVLLAIASFLCWDGSY